MPKEALLVIDMLKDFVLPGAPLEVPDTRKIIPVIKKEIERARTNNYPVIYICDRHEPDDKEFRKFGWPPHAVRGSSGADVVDELRPQEGDLIVEKNTYDGFYKTRLEDILRANGVESLRLTGCVTNICVLFTASSAVLRDFKVIVIEDGVAGLNTDDHIAALRNMKNVLGVNIQKGG